MARNVKPEYIRRLLATVAPNGYKFDVANYLHNPSFAHEYPSFVKLLAESDERKTFRRVYYFKHYDGNGEYCAETYSLDKRGEGWQIARDVKTEILEPSNRFNLKRLLTYRS